MIAVTKSPRHRKELLPPILAALVLLPACGGGTAALAGGSGSGGSPKKNSAPSVPVLEVPAGLSELSPATIRFTLADPEGNPISVKLEYESPAGSGLKDMTLANEGDLVDLPTSPSGVMHQAVWNFAADLGTTSLTEGVHVVLTATGGQGKVEPGTVLGELLAADFGNNPAQILLTCLDIDGTPGCDRPGSEVVGIAQIRFTVADDSGHSVSIIPEYRVAGSVDWLPATPAGQLPAAFEAPPAPGVTLDFFWSVKVDLGLSEHDVEFRFTANDGFTLATGPLVPGEPATFRVDNNAAPSVDFDDVSFALNPDQHDGIPVPFTVADAEGDEVAVVFQWMREGESVPPLPDDPAGLAAVLADPVQRAAHHVATPWPLFVGGRVVPVDGDSLRLPELAVDGSRLLRPAALAAAGVDVADALAGRTLDILRPSRIAAPVAGSWAQNPLRDPVATLPVGDGLTAFVLDRPGFAQWRLREIELATGEVVREIAASGAGTASAMTWEPDRTSVLVADHLSGLLWTVHRVDLAGGVVTPVVGVRDVSAALGIVRGLAAIGRGAAVATIGDALVRLDYLDPGSPTGATLLSGLSSPWGVAVDPLNPSRVYVAERDGQGPGGPGRVVTIDLHTRVKLVVGASVTSGRDALLPRPEALAFEAGKARLLVVTDADPTDGTKELVAVNVGRAGEDEVFTLVADLPGGTSHVATGPDGLTLLSLADADDLAVGGGLLQRRSVQSWDPYTQTVELTTALDVAVSPASRWRIPVHSSLVPARPDGTDGTFVWDSRDVGGWGEVLLQATPVDTDLGVTVRTDGARTVRAPYDAPVVLPSSGSPSATRLADLDGDGDLDVVTADVLGHQLMVHFQGEAGQFQGVDLITPFAQIPYLNDVDVADLDQDGDQDIVVARQNTQGNDNRLLLFLQQGPGVFDREPIVLAGGSSSSADVDAADLDADGDIDLISGDGSGVTVFHGRGEGDFDPPVELPTSSMLPVSSVASLDADGDGDLDLVAGTGGSPTLLGTLELFPQVAAGSFGSAQVVYAEFPSSSDPVDVSPADLDQDGRPDLALALDRLHLSSFAQIAPGVFSSDPLTLGDDVPAFQPTGLGVGDTDGDGDVDLVAKDFGTHRLVFFHGTGSLDGDRPSSWIEGEGDVDFGDLDGDGRLDLARVKVGGNPGSGLNDASVLRHADGLGFDTAPLVLVTAFFSAELDPAPADMDGDGDVDLLGLFTASPAILHQRSPGVFDASPVVVGALGDTTQALEAADLDGDGAVDLVAHRSGKFQVFFHATPEAFEVELVLVMPTSIANTTSVAAGDLDGDGDLDLARAMPPLAEGVSLHFQTAPRAFDPRPLLLPSGLGSRTVDPADLDTDGDLDLVVITDDSFSVPRLVAFFQDESGAFSPPATLSDVFIGGFYARDLDDLDGDGDLDIAVRSGFEIALLLQISSGLFEDDPILLGTFGETNPQSISIVDIDGDGDLDIASGNLNPKTVTIYRQVRPREFDDPALTIDVPGPGVALFGSLASDVDGDGDADLLAVTVDEFLASQLTILFGNH